MREGRLKCCLFLHPSPCFAHPNLEGSTHAFQTMQRLKLGLFCWLKPAAWHAGRETGLLPQPTLATPTKIKRGYLLLSLWLRRDCFLFPLEHQWNKKETSIWSQACPSPGHLYLLQMESKQKLSPSEIPRGDCINETHPSSCFLCNMLIIGENLGESETFWCAQWAIQVPP